MSIYQMILNNWEAFAFIFCMITFVLALLFVMLICIAKQDNPNMELPKFIEWFIKTTGI